MNIERFLAILPELYHDFGQVYLSPKNDFFPKLQQLFQSSTSANVMQILNAAVICLESGEVYCQTSTTPITTLIAALVDNPEIMAYAVSELSEDELLKVSDHLADFNCEDQVCLCNQSLTDFLQELAELNIEDKIGIYYHDQSQQYRDVLISLMSIKPFLSDEALIVLANTNNPDVKQAILDFISWHQNQTHELLNNSDFDQGLIILLWQPNQDKLRDKKITEKGLFKLRNSQNQGKNIVLHVGCGAWRPDALPDLFDQPQWEELRLDIDHRVKPDLVSSILDLSILKDDSVNAVYSSHNLEHIYNFEVPITLAEFKRVLKPGGLILLIVPDIQLAADWVAKEKLESPPMYNSPAGGVPALWMFYGMGTSIANIPYMAHKTGFTATSLRAKITEVGFNKVETIRDNFNIIAYGYK